METIKFRLTHGLGAVLLLLLASLPLTASAQAAVYDAFNDFSTTTNPNGVWRYGCTTAIGSSFQLFGANAFALSNSAFSWSVVSDGDPHIGKNLTSEDIIEPDSLAIFHASKFLDVHPGPSGEFSVTRFTAPVSGIYQLAAGFCSDRYAGSNTTTDIHVLQNSASIFDSTIDSLEPGSEQDFTQTVSLNAGDTLDFAVGANGNYVCDSTGVKATITLVSGSSTIAQLATGAASWVGPTTSALHGSVLLGNKPVTVQFQYGSSTGYGSATPFRPLPAGTGIMPATAKLTGLHPLQTYHYRIVETGDSGTIYGGDQTFTTKASAQSDFDGDGIDDWVYFNATTGETQITIMDAGAVVRTVIAGPQIPAGWVLARVADCDGDGTPDFVLSNPSTGQTEFWYLSVDFSSSNASVNVVETNAGPTIPKPLSLSGIADFNGDGERDFVLLNPNTGATSFRYLHNGSVTGIEDGPHAIAGSVVGAIVGLNNSGDFDLLLQKETHVEVLFRSTKSSVELSKGLRVIGAGMVAPDSRSVVLFRQGSQSYYSNRITGQKGTLHDGPVIPDGFILVAPK